MARQDVGLNVERLSADRWALYIAAALANTRTSNIGRKEVNDWHPSVASGERPAYDKAAWDRVRSAHQDNRQLAEAMVAKATTRSVEGVTVDMVAKWAASVRGRLTEHRPLRPRIIPWSEAVIWLVGRGIEPGAFERVRLWRRAGVDARCLLLDARQSTRTGQWVVRIQREAFPERDLALDALASAQQVIEESQDAEYLMLRFYDTPFASNRETHLGGLPLRDRTEAFQVNKDGTWVPVFQANHETR